MINHTDMILVGHSHLHITLARIGPHGVDESPRHCAWVFMSAATPF